MLTPERKYEIEQMLQQQGSAPQGNSGLDPQRMLEIDSMLQQQPAQSEPEKQGLLKTFGQGILDIARQPATFVGKLGSTIGEAAAKTDFGKQIGEGLAGMLNIKTPEQAVQVKEAFEAPTSFTATDRDLSGFESGKEAIGEGILAASNLATPFLGTGSLPTRLATGFGIGSAYGGGEALREDKNLDETISQAGSSGLFGMAVEAGIPILGRGLRTVFDKAAPVLRETKVGQALKPSAIRDKIINVAGGVPTERVGAYADLARNNPTKLAELTSIVTNPETRDKPLIGIVERVVENINRRRNEIKNSFKKSVQQYRNSFGDTVFDLNFRMPEVNNILNDFGLNVSQQRSKTGQLLGETNVNPLGKITDFSDKERGLINGLINDLRTAQDVSVDDLLALRGRFDKAYNAIRTKPDGTPTKYHALVAQLTDKADDFIKKTMPDDLKKVYSQYQSLLSKGRNVVNKLVDGGGNVKPGAESFLSNITSKNKGQLQKEVTALKDDLDIDILSEIDALETVQMMNNIRPVKYKDSFDDLLRGFVTNQLVGAGLVITNPQLLIPILMINLAASPKLWSKFIQYSERGRGAFPKEFLDELFEATRPYLQPLIEAGVIKQSTQNSVPSTTEQRQSQTTSLQNQVGSPTNTQQPLLGQFDQNGGFQASNLPSSLPRV